MRGNSIDEVTALARSARLDLGSEARAVAERLTQLVGFARELDGIVDDELEIDAAFDPAWEFPR